MEIFPESVLYSFPMAIDEEWRTLISDAESGKEQRRKCWAFPKRGAGLNHKCVKLEEFKTVWKFYHERCGAHEKFYFIFPNFGGSGDYWYGEYLGQGDGSETTFDLRSKDTNASSVTVYVDGTPVSHTFISGGGQAGMDRVQISAPSEGEIVTADFQGRLVLDARFLQDKLTKELFNALMFNAQVPVIEVKRT